MLYTDWLHKLYEELASTGQEGLAAVQYMRAHGTQLGFKQARPNLGAFWTLRGNIKLNARHYSYETSLTDPYFLSLIVHEVRHLQQGIVVALSVYGELEAWQMGLRTYHNLTGRYPRHPAIEELMTLSHGWKRETLSLARKLMRAYSGRGYRIDLLPVYPLPAEILFRVTGRKPKAQG